MDFALFCRDTDGELVVLGAVTCDAVEGLEPLQLAVENAGWQVIGRGRMIPRPQFIYEMTKPLEDAWPVS